MMDQTRALLKQLMQEGTQGRGDVVLLFVVFEEKVTDHQTGSSLEILIHE